MKWFSWGQPQGDEILEELFLTYSSSTQRSQVCFVPLLHFLLTLDLPANKWWTLNTRATTHCTTGSASVAWLISTIRSIFYSRLGIIMLCMYNHLWFHLTIVFFWGVEWVENGGTRLLCNFQLSVGTSFSKGSSFALTENNSVETYDNRLHNWKCISHVNWVKDPCSLIVSHSSTIVYHFSGLHESVNSFATVR